MAETTVRLRVQVIDENPQILDLQVPTYLVARDLTQRIARDAGLSAWWSDRTRREYRLRARGRLVDGNEKLEAFGVVDGELVYLLPQPPDERVVERPPEWPPRRGSKPGTWHTLVPAVGVNLLWAGLWGGAVSVTDSLFIATVPGLAHGLLCSSTARRLWGPPGTSPRVGFTGIALAGFLAFVASLGQVLAGRELGDAFLLAIPMWLSAGLGALTGWLAWWGAAEPLPPDIELQTAGPQAEVLPACAVCGTGVDPSVRHDCASACGRVMHEGCHRARVAMYRGDRSICVVCGQVGQA